MNNISAVDLVALHERGALLLVDDPYPLKPTQRWGYGKPPHEHLARLFHAQREKYQPFLEDIATMVPWFEAISYQAPEDSLEPRWDNGWLPILTA